MNTLIFKAIPTHSYIIFSTFTVLKNGKAIPLQAWAGPEGSRWLRLPRYLHNQHMKAASLSARSTGSNAGWKTDELSCNSQQGYKILYTS
jgi:hypothetical protein